MAERIYGIRVAAGDMECWGGSGAGRYEFQTAAAARRFMDANWPQMSAAWKRRHLKVAAYPQQ